MTDVVDGHVHVWTLDPERYPWQPTLPGVPPPQEPATVEQLLDDMDRAGVAEAVLVQPSVYGWDNTYLCEALDRHPDRFHGVCLVDAHASSAGIELRRWCVERRCRGVRLNLIAERDVAWTLAPATSGYWDAVRELGISVSVQMAPAQAATVCELARRHVDVRFVVDYVGGEAVANGAAATALTALAAHDNVACKVIPLGHESGKPFPWPDMWATWERVIAAFGARRVVFGTDAPFARAAADYPTTVSWLSQVPFIDDAARDRIGAANARELWAW